MHSKTFDVETFAFPLHPLRDPIPCTITDRYTTFPYPY